MHLWKYLFFASIIFLGSLQANWTTSPTTIDSISASSAAPLVVDPEGNVTPGWLEASIQDVQAAFFSTALQRWMSPQSIIVAGAGLNTPQLIVDKFGTVTLIWRELFRESVNNLTLFASRSTKGGPWTTPVPLNSLPSSTPTDAQIPVSMVVDAQGNVTVAWLEQDLTSTNYAIGTARFTADINTAPTLYPFLDGASPNANSNVVPQLVVDQLGYVTAVWQENTGVNFAVQAARLSPSGSAWSTPFNLDGVSPNANGAITPQMVVDTTGVVTAVWQEKSGAQVAVQTARFVPTTGGGGAWTTYTALAPALANADGSLAPAIIVDKNNSVTITAVDAALLVWPSSFVTGASSWTYPLVPLNNGAVYTLTPLSMVADDSGVVTALWLNDTGTGGIAVQAARGFSTSWSGATNLDTGNADGNTPLLLVVDDFGTVTASWMEVSTIQAARHPAGDISWGPTTTLDNGNLYNLIAPKMVMGPSGAVTVVWQEGAGGGPYAIQAARFTPGSTSWTQPVTLDNGSQSPNAYFSSMTQQINMVVDDFDNVTVTWMESVGLNTVIQAARFSAPPVVSSVSPNQGPTSGGNAVTITGGNFTNILNVYFGSTPVTALTVNSANSITVIAPAGAAGTVDITVVTDNGTSTITPEDHYTYIHVAPLHVPPPSHFDGYLKKNKHGKKYVLKTDWHKSNSKNVVFYLIYKKNDLVKRVLAKHRHTTLHNIHSEHSAKKFYISAENVSGPTSKRVKIKVSD